MQYKFYRKHVSRKNPFFRVLLALTARCDTFTLDPIHRNPFPRKTREKLSVVKLLRSDSVAWSNIESNVR